MTQSRIHYDHDEALGALARAREEAQLLSSLHSRARPGMSSTAAGRDFTATAERLQAAFLRVHQAGQRRIDVLDESLGAGAAQVHNFTQTDADNATTFRGRDQ